MKIKFTPRRVVQITAAMVTTQGGFSRQTLFALADDGNVFRLDGDFNYPPRDGLRWQSVPSLPAHEEYTDADA